MDEFLGIASHELRTPLTSITANVQYSRKQVRRFVGGSTASSQDEAIACLRRLEPLLDRTDRQLARLDRLVGDLLDVSRIQSGKLALELAPADLCDIVRDCVEGQRASSPDRNITLALLRRCPVPIAADADRIGQVITNYLTNALRYSPPGTPIAVHLLVRDNRARVAVRDEGIGIPQEEQQRIWERFHRVPGAEHERQGGSGVGLGLGLYLCASIVERHGGQVGVESALGKGSTFW